MRISLNLAVTSLSAQTFVIALSNQPNVLDESSGSHVSRSIGLISHEAVDAVASNRDETIAEFMSIQ